MSKFIIIKKTSEGKKFLKHVGCNHEWTADKSLAMEYGAFEIANALAAKMGGELEAA